MITIGSMVKWILENRSNKVFKEWTESEIAVAVKTGIENNLLLYSATSDGKILGMILALRFDKDKVIFVVENLATRMTVLKEFARRAKLMFPGYRLEAMRHGKYRHFNTEKLYNKLT